MYKIEIADTRCKYIIELKSKASVVIGDSGVGKTTFVELIRSRRDRAVLFNTTDNRRIVILQQDTWQDVLAMQEINQQPTLYIIDDMNFIFTVEFARLYKRVKKSYFLFFVRGELYGNNRLTKCTTIPISSYSIYTLSYDGKQHALKCVSEDFETSMLQKGDSVNYVICEDMKSGNQFFSQFLRIINTQGGRDAVIRYCIQNKTQLAGKILLLIIDAASASSKLWSTISFLSSLGISVKVIKGYESFEYMLLRSNMFSWDDIYNEEELLAVNSLEIYCYEQLVKETRKCPYAYNKSRLSSCYIDDCCTKAMCDKQMLGNKLDRLLAGTLFENVIYIKQEV